ncbi:hypothetical protein FIBSPDRAFT_964945 [Athelia psychrophila]|uniref:Retrotransposon Copia-like N-terminal domain-containing protein n=1 Tax=Athelia psychrophila TaxID=1759441 RepID=A0A165X6D8_9AGAM|nr:hypothetical protein FIBSPDRAFT_964945 [Fibularhizoctonia sp. CBS 109695]
MINSLNNDSSFKHLNMTLDNYTEWSKSLIQICELNNITDYILGNVVEPTYNYTANTENVGYWAFEANNKQIVAFIKINISDLEKPYVTTSLAHEAWTTLKDRHIGRGLIIQTALMQEAFGISFGPEVADLPDLTRKMQDLVGRIYMQGLPTEGTFLIVMLLNALEAHHPTIGNDTCTQYTNNPSTGSQWLLSRISQEVVWRGKLTTSSDFVIVKGGNGRPVCEVCASVGHSKRTCWQKGGDMFSKEAEQREIIRKRHEENGGGCGRCGKPIGRGGKVNHNPFRRTTDGRSYIIDADTKEAVFISNSNASDKTAAITSPALSSAGPSGTSNLALMAVHAPSASAIAKTWSFNDSSDEEYGLSQ